MNVSNANSRSSTELAATSHTAPPIASRLTLAIAALLLVIFLLQFGWFIRTQSFTNDEPVKGGEKGNQC